MIPRRVLATYLLAIAFAGVNGKPASTTAAMAPAYTSALARALSQVGRHHSVAGRLSGGLVPGDATPWRERKLASVVADLERAADREQRSVHLGALASWRLVSGRSRSATRLFEQALGSAPRDARLHNDLAVCLLAAGREEGRIDLLLRALEEAERARTLDPHLVEAAYNRALILHMVGLVREGGGAWRQFLTLDSESSWALRARDYMASAPDAVLPDKLPDPVAAPLATGNKPAVIEHVRRAPERARLYLQDEVLPHWAEASASNRPREAARALDLAQVLADALAAATGDLLPQSTVTHVREAINSEHLVTLRSGLLAYREARRQWKASRPAAAGPLFAAAERAFAAAGSPFEAAAQYGRAASAYEAKRLAEAGELLSPLLTKAESRGYRFVLGRSRWLRAMVALESGRPDDAARDLEAALQLFESAGESEHAVQVSARLANAYGYLGESAKAWQVRGHALRSIRPQAGSVATIEVLAEATRAAGKAGFVAAGLAFQSEHLALVGDDPISLAEGYRRRGLLHSRAGIRSKALADLERALRECDQIEDPGFRRHVRAGILTVLGSIEAVHAPERALAALSEAWGIYHASGFVFLDADILLDRSRSLRALGEVDAAERDLRAALREFELQRAGIAGHSRRVTFFDRAREVVEELVALRVGQGRTDLALADIERGRAKGLLQASGGGANSLNAAQLRSGIPSRHAVIEYLVTGRRTFAWALTPQSAEFREVLVDRQRLESMVVGCRAGLQTGTSGVIEPCATLRTLLVDPFARQIQDADEIVFVPDGPLHALPFSALPDASGRPLVADSRIGNSPSASVYVNRMMRAAKDGSEDHWTMLAVGNPSFDRARHPGLSSLRGAEEEAAAVAAGFPGSDVLIGSQATPERFLNGLADHELIHFAGHALYNADEPERSRLVFAPDGGGDDSLEASALLAAPLERVRLVVLSACETALGGESLEGTTGFAAPFLTAGVPAVIGSLWPIEDRDAREFWQFFYEAIRQTRSASTALRAAQLGMLESGDGISRSSTWAAFQLTGASPPQRGEGGGTR